MVKLKYLTASMLLAGMSFISCWYYGFSGKSLPGVDSVSIPVFEDRTAEFQIKEKLQNQLITTFQEENIFKIASSSAADAIMSGVIISVSQRSASVDRNEVANRTELSIIVEISLNQRGTGKEIIKKQRFTATGFFVDITDREEAIDEALVKLTRDIADRILSDW